jgi:hypothetical protein
MTADGIGTNTIMRQTGKSKVTVWRWQERFMAQGSTGQQHGGDPVLQPEYHLARILRQRLLRLLSVSAIRMLAR